MAAPPPLLLSWRADVGRLASHELSHASSHDLPWLRLPCPTKPWSLIPCLLLPWPLLPWSSMVVQGHFSHACVLQDGFFSSTSFFLKLPPPYLSASRLACVDWIDPWILIALQFMILLLEREARVQIFLFLCLKISLLKDKISHPGDSVGFGELRLIDLRENSSRPKIYFSFLGNDIIPKQSLGFQFCR